LDSEHLVHLFGKPPSDISVRSLVTTLSSCRELYRSDYLGFIECPREGICLVFEDETWKTRGIVSPQGPMKLAAIHFYSAGKDNYSSFLGKLPEGITFNQTSEQIAKTLGPRARTGGDGVGTPFWDRFDRQGYSIHVTYRNDGTVELVTLLDPQNE